MSPKSNRTALELLSQKKVAIFIVLYNSAHFIEKVLARIPKKLRGKFEEIFIIDDFSHDQSYRTAKKAAAKLGIKNIRILQTPHNRGYGGNQKLGYLYAIRRKFDIVVLLHGDGQYAPESLPHMLEPFHDESTDAVFGSRMKNKLDALIGRMPLYKWLGNIILTSVENSLLGSNLSEFHSGYRAYKVQALKNIPFEKNSDDFHFDTEIIIQLLAAGKKIEEVKVPTYYGSEICHVNGIQYAFNCFISVLKYKISRLGIFYEPNFDIVTKKNKNKYPLKISPYSIHQYIINQEYNPSDKIVDLGANNGRISSFLAKKVKKVLSVDKCAPQNAGEAQTIALDLDGPFDKQLKKKFDTALALDVIEHLNNPEGTIKKISNILKPNGILYASTANVAYVPIRLSLLFGMFNYGRRGILDLTHKRLFTINSFIKLMSQNGFEIIWVQYFGPPILDYAGGGILFKLIDKSFYHIAQFFPSLFAYQLLVKAKRKEAIEDIYKKVFHPASAFPVSKKSSTRA